jgi:hypothetical protein
MFYSNCCFKNTKKRFNFLQTPQKPAASALHAAAREPKDQRILAERRLRQLQQSPREAVARLKEVVSPMTSPHLGHVLRTIAPPHSPNGFLMRFAIL